MNRVVQVCVGLGVVCVLLGLGQLDRWRGAKGPVLHRVAHAGGAFNDRVYTNSREAIEASLERGFRWVEIDFTWTADDHLVCLHDWEDNFYWLFGYRAPGPLTLEEFEDAARSLDLSLLTLEQLADVMRDHPELVVITDIKGDNLPGLWKVMDTLPAAERRVIPQIYQPEEYAAALRMGYQRLIWTLYGYPHREDMDRVVAEVSAMDLLAVCMPEELAEAGLAHALGEHDIPTYVHTINDPDRWLHLQNEWGVTEIYTDFLPAE